MHFSRASDGTSAASLTIVFSPLLCGGDMSVGACRGWGCQIPLQLQLQAVMSCLPWLLAVRSVDALEHGAVSPALSQLLSD